MKVYTKTGDKGTTSLLGGKRVSKSDDRINAYGTIDELNSYIGLLRDQDVNIDRLDVLKDIQDRLFTIGALLAADPEYNRKKVPDLYESDIAMLETEMDKMDEQLSPMKSFLLPGGHSSVSFCHIARCVCRRAERLVISLSELEEVDPLIIKYLNRLSDYLFVLSRQMSKDLKVEEILWKPRMA